MESSGNFERTHTWRKVEPEAYRASNAALSRPVGTNYHIQVRTGTEFDKVIGDEVLELNPHNGSRHISLTEIRSCPDGVGICSPIRVSG